MKLLKLVGCILLFALAFPINAQAQDAECTRIVSQALATVDQICETTGRNQACYGNITLLAEPRVNAGTFVFDQAGDVVDIAAVQTLALSSYNATTEEWGVAVLRVQANLPDTLPGQNVTFLLFGDAEIQDSIAEIPPEPATLELTIPGNLNVRDGPSTSHAVIGSLRSGDTVMAVGRLDDSSWLQIQLDDDTLGWVFTQLTTPESDVTALSVVDPDAEQPAQPMFGPFQAFYFKSGANDAPCVAAPDSGILIQTPEGDAEIDLVVNEVTIRLHSTAYIQSQPDGEMTVNLIEGNARVAAQGRSIFVPAGTRVRIRMDDNNRAVDVPSDPEAYDDAMIARLPVSVLPRKIEAATALTPEEIDATVNVDVTGEWVVVEQESACDGFDTSSFSSSLGSHQLLSGPDEEGNIRGEPPEGGGFIIAFTTEMTEDGDYKIIFDNFNPPPGAPQNDYYLRILSSDQVEIFREFEIVRGRTYPCTTSLILEPVQ